MSDNIQKLQSALQFALANRPSVGGFPFLAECLRRSGVRHNIWTLPACQSIYVMDGGSVVSQMAPLETSLAPIPPFDEQALIAALRVDQAGQTTFPEFLRAAWNAGVVTYDVDFDQRCVTYSGIDGERYQEKYPAVEINL